jgi:acyl carrier protein
MSESLGELSSLKQELKVLIVEQLDLRHKTAEEIDDDAPLFGGGLGLDSLDALQLAMAVEERFGIAVPEGEGTRAAFASVSALAEFVASQRSG